MGKKTLFHPVSLHVIRGAAEFLGWTFGKIEQLDSDQAASTAMYRAEITGFPVNPDGRSLGDLEFMLANCFMNDITPRHLRRTSDEKWYVTLNIDLSRTKQPPTPSLSVEQWRAMNEGREALRKAGGNE